jgi:hypothetical protein
MAFAHQRSLPGREYGVCFTTLATVFRRQNRLYTPRLQSSDINESIGVQNRVTSADLFRLSTHTGGVFSCWSMFLEGSVANPHSPARISEGLGVRGVHRCSLLARYFRLSVHDYCEGEVEGSEANLHNVQAKA